MPPQLPTPPATLNDFKKRFSRDFKYGSGKENVTDDDIANAMTDAMTVFNPGLFSVADGWVAFLLVTAHYVRINIEAAGGLQAEAEGLGVENQAEQVLGGAGAGGVNKSYVQPPEFVKKVPLLLQLWLTTYGQKYVAMLQPKLVGNVGAVEGPIYFDTSANDAVPGAPEVTP
jgi:hypothetical protein